MMNDAGAHVHDGAGPSRTVEERFVQACFTDDDRKIHICALCVLGFNRI